MDDVAGLPDELDDYLALIERERDGRPAEARLADEVLRLRAELETATSVETLEALRRDERHRLAGFFESNASTLQGFQPDGLTIEMLAFLLRLDHD